MSADLSRTAADLTELERRLSRALGTLQAGPKERRSKRQAEAEEQVLQAYREARQLADQATTLSECLRQSVEFLDEADRRAAARIPSVPRLTGVLPVLRPDNQPWPFAPAPPVTMIRAPRPATTNVTSLVDGADGTPPASEGRA